MIRNLGIVFIFMLCIFAPNLFWLDNSTARFSNGSPHILNDVTIMVDDKMVFSGDIPPGDRIFMWLPKSGDASFEVRFVREGVGEKTCQTYVEGDMHHVDVSFTDGGELICDGSLPLLFGLFILKIL